MEESEREFLEGATWHPTEKQCSFTANGTEVEAEKLGLPISRDSSYKPRHLS